MPKTSNITEELERLIDSTSLLHVLLGLELVCAEKAEHLRANWQDNVSARTWDCASRACGKVARHDAVQALAS